MRKKRILRIYNKIAQITQKGKGSFMEYYNYIDDVINNGEYSILQDVYINYFDVDIRLYKSITIMKQKTWNLIGISVNPLFQNRFVDYCEDNGVYQVGKYFYDSSNNEQLGEFTIVNRANTINYLGVTYSYYPDTIYYRNTDLYKNAFNKISNTNKNNTTNKYLANIYKIAQIALAQFNINTNQIFSENYCTYSQAELFYSYRREPYCSNRMFSVIWID